MTTTTDTNAAVTILRATLKTVGNYCAGFYANAKVRGAEAAHTRAHEMAMLAESVLADTAPVAAIQPSEPTLREMELEAARIAYASEFPLNADGEPDTGNIHANIRKLKAQVAAIQPAGRQWDEFGRTNSGDETGGSVQRFGFDCTKLPVDIIPATNGGFVYYDAYLKLFKEHAASAPAQPEAKGEALYGAALKALETLRGCAATYVEDHSKDTYPGVTGLRPQDVANMWGAEIHAIDVKAFLDEAIADAAPVPAAPADKGEFLPMPKCDASYSGGRFYSEQTVQACILADRARQAAKPTANEETFAANVLARLAALDAPDVSLSLAAQILDIAPCTDCGFRKRYCRCQAAIAQPIIPCVCQECGSDHGWRDFYTGATKTHEVCAKCWTKREHLTQLSYAAKPSGAVDGFALVPLIPNRAMERVMEDDTWQWEDLLAAAAAITEDQYDEIAAAPQPPASTAPAASEVIAWRLAPPGKGMLGLTTYDKSYADSCILQGYTLVQELADARSAASAKDAIATAYGILWHVNASMDAPAEVSPLSVTPERGAYEARKVLRDLLTREQRGFGINAAREVLAAIATTKATK